MHNPIQIVNLALSSRQLEDQGVTFIPEIAQLAAEHTRQGKWQSGAFYRSITAVGRPRHRH